MYWELYPLSAYVLKNVPFRRRAGGRTWDEPEHPV